MRKLIIIILSFLLSYTALGVTHVKSGDVITKEGYFFTADEEKTLRANNEKRKLFIKLVAKYEDKIELQDYRLDLYKKYTEDSRPLNNWQKTGYVILGVLATSASLYIASKINNNLK